ncbi:iron transporter [Vibrio cholerae]|nr:iron transporter [Vibrio cholerae]
MVAVVVFESSGMRCQPLRRALTFKIGTYETKSILIL